MPSLLAEVPRLGCSRLRTLRVQPDVLSEKEVPMRPGITSDFICKQLYGFVFPNYAVPTFLDMRTGQIKIGKLKENLGRDYVSSIELIPDLMKVLDDPNDDLCQRDPEHSFMFFWDGNITTSEELITTLKKRNVTISEGQLANIIRSWENSWRYRKIIKCRDKSTRKNLIKAVVGRLGEEACLEKRPEACLLSGILEDITANRLSAFKSFAHQHPSLVYDFSSMDLGELSFEMALEILGISKLFITPHVCADHIDNFKQFLLYANQGNLNITTMETMQYLSPNDFRLRRVKMVRLSRKGITFIIGGKRSFYRIKSLQWLRYDVLNGYLHRIVDDIHRPSQDLLLDYYEELSEEAIRMGITTPDNYDEETDSPFQKLMERLLNKYFGLLKKRLNLPPWATATFHRDRAMVQISYGLKGRFSGSVVSGFDFRFVKSYNPASGDFMFASSSLFSKETITETNWQRLNEVARRWREVNPELGFGVH